MKWEGGCLKEKRLLLTILERSAVARATNGTRDWYLEQRSSGRTAEELMFGTHLGSTNTSHLFSCFSDTLPASSLQPTQSPYRETPRGRCPIFFYSFTLVLHEPEPSLLFSMCIRCSRCLSFCIMSVCHVQYCNDQSCVMLCTGLTPCLRLRRVALSGLMHRYFGTDRIFWHACICFLSHLFTFTC